MASTIRWMIRILQFTSLCRSLLTSISVFCVSIQLFCCTIIGHILVTQLAVVSHLGNWPSTSAREFVLLYSHHLTIYITFYIPSWRQLKELRCWLHRERLASGLCSMIDNVRWLVDRKSCIINSPFYHCLWLFE